MAAHGIIDDENRIMKPDARAQSANVTRSDIEVAKRVLVERVAHREEHFVYLCQRDEPNLSLDERLLLVDKLLSNKPGEFLARFGSSLTFEDLLYFDSVCSDDYIVQFRLTEIRQRLNDIGSKGQQALVRNRRYEAMRRLEAEGEYFSDEDMKRRDPLLYEDMIGQHLTGDDAQAMVATDKDHALSEVLLQHIQVMQNNELYERMKDAEESQMEEEESDGSDDDSAHDKSIDGDEVLSGYQKAVLRNEFIEIMKQRFLDGKDSEFNYSEVDDNADYDALEQVSRDAEDEYFMHDDDNDDAAETSDSRTQPDAEYDF